MNTTDPNEPNRAAPPGSAHPQPEPTDTDALFNADPEVAALIGSSVHPVTPPAHLKDALLSSIAEVVQTPASTAPTRVAPGQGESAGQGHDDGGGHDGERRGQGATTSVKGARTWLPAIVAAAAAVILVAGIGIGTLVDQGAGPVAESTDGPSAQVSEPGDGEGDVQAAAMESLKDAGDIQKLSVDASGTQLTLMYSRDLNAAALSWPAAMSVPSGMEPHVWVGPSVDKMESAGAPAGAGQDYVVLPDVPAAGMHVMLTVEDSANPQVPSTDHMMGEVTMP